MEKHANDATVDAEEVFSYLDDLRESGATNMFGARPYIMREFRVSSEKAGALLSEWMRTFSTRHAATQ